ncbi:MAG TPA: class I mannose-6-phosphate isomerase [Gemmatales bacterium]|nr:class I mannose-6-phosphate isomerase [Gemmatales bacterium]
MMPASPIILKPWLRAMPWGGYHLSTLLDGTVCENPIGEAWLLSDHPRHESLLQTDGNITLRDTIAAEQRANPATRFPLLIKLLDANQNLSIQVHPNDQQAKQWSPKDGGKTEAWVVLAAEPDAAIYLGLKPGIDLATFARELASGNAPLCLNRYEPKPGETYFVPAGTVHALGQGVLVLEVQQTSDATYRLYDWGRTGADGKPRELHLEAGQACTQVAPVGAGLQTPRRDPDGAERLVKCPFFTLRRWTSAGTISVNSPAIVIPWGNSVRVQSSGGILMQGHACLTPAPMGQAVFEVPPDTTLFEISWTIRN